MPIIELFAEVKSLGFTAIRALASLITDNFNRVTSGSLGLNPTGNLWNAIRGTWYATGTQAQSDDSATNYSIATLQAYSQDVTASASVSGGTGVAFWVSDAGSWWAAVPYYNTYTYALPACSCGTYTQTNDPGSCNPNGSGYCTGCICGSNPPTSGSYSVQYYGQSCYY